MELTKSWQRCGSSGFKHTYATNTLTFTYYIRYQDVAGNPLRKEIQMYAECACPSPSYYRLSAGDNNACKHGIYTTLNGANQKAIEYTFKITGQVKYPLDDSDITNYMVSWLVDYDSTGKWSGTFSSNLQMSYYSGSDISGCYYYTSGGARYGITVNSAATVNEVSLPDLVPVTVSVSANPPYGGTVSGGGSVYAGSSATVTATPNILYEFTNWTEGGTEVSTNTSYTFDVEGDTTLVANFESDSDLVRWYIISS